MLGIYSLPVAFAYSRSVVLVVLFKNCFGPVTNYTSSEPHYIQKCFSHTEQITRTDKLDMRESPISSFFICFF